MSVLWSTRLVGEWRDFGSILPGNTVALIGVVYYYNIFPPVVYQMYAGTVSVGFPSGGFESPKCCCE